MKDSDHQLMYSLEGEYWYWQGKNDLILKLVDRYLKNRKNAKILDVGCGTGSLLQALKGRGELHGADLSPYALKLCKKRGTFKLKVMNAEKLAYPKNYFDLVILSDIIEHTDHDKKVVQKVYDIVKPGGYAIITVPAFMHLWNKDDERLHHRRRYTSSRLRAVKGKFRVRQMSFIHFLVYPMVVAARVKEKILPSKKTIELVLKDKLKKRSLMFTAMNKTLLAIHKIENSVLQMVPLPWGVSLLMVLQKRR